MSWRMNLCSTLSKVPKTNTDYYQPSKRYDHSTIVIGDNLYLWGGDQLDTHRIHDSPEKRHQTSCIEIFNLPSWRWKQQETFGEPPLGVSGYACASIENCIYYFGGWCGHDDCYHNSLYQIDVISFQWKPLFPTNDMNGPVRKARSGMVSFKHNLDDFLFVLGGICLPPIIPNPNAEFKCLFGEMRTNEQHIFDVSKGIWLTPTVVGEPSPCDSFTLEKLSHNRAIMFGGCGTEEEMYIAKLTRRIVDWQMISRPWYHSIASAWPSERWDHASTVVSFDRKYEIPEIALVLGGDGTPDCWLYDVDKTTWTEIKLPQDIVDRHVHSLSAFCVEPLCIWLVIFGGRKGTRYLSDTRLLKLSYKDSQWLATEDMDSEALEKAGQDYIRLTEQKRPVKKALKKGISTPSFYSPSHCKKRNTFARRFRRSFHALNSDNSS